MEQNTQALALKQITGDQESWLKSNLVSLVGLCIDIEKNKGVVADNGMIEGAIQGAIERQALEIIGTLGCKPEYTNLPTPDWWFSERRKSRKNIGKLG
jgi:hypothetical protein